MSTAFLCDLCSGFRGGLGIPPVGATHCFGGGDRPGTPGVIGSGNYCPCKCRSWPHTPMQLFGLAASEHPDDDTARRDRYRALMVEHGHLVKREPGQSVNLPCGWPHRPEPDADPAVTGDEQ